MYFPELYAHNTYLEFTTHILPKAQNLKLKQHINTYGPKPKNLQT